MRTSILLLALVAPGLAAQDPDSLRADSAFRRRDWRATAGLYTGIASRFTAQGMAWLRAGLARHALNELDPAIAAYEQALALQFQPATAMYRLARVHADSGTTWQPGFDGRYTRKER